MENISAKAGYKLFLQNKSIYSKKEGNEELLYCPYCNKALTELNVMDDFCTQCNKSLRADENGIRQLLIQEHLENIIPILEEKKLLDIYKFSELKAKDIKKLGCDKNSKKKLKSVLNISNRLGYLITLCVIGLGVIIGVLIKLISAFGFNIAMFIVFTFIPFLIFTIKDELGL